MPDEMYKLQEHFVFWDEPTTGLHPSDFENLTAQRDGLVEGGRRADGRVGNPCRSPPPRTAGGHDTSRDLSALKFGAVNDRPCKFHVIGDHANLPHQSGRTIEKKPRVKQEAPDFMGICGRRLRAGLRIVSDYIPF